MPEPFLVGSIDWMDNTAMKNHTLGHSVADLIDNSIDANAEMADVVLKVEDFPVSSEVNRNVLSFYIIDDGDGIAAERLEGVLTVQRRRDADGNEAYHETHLGAFGLGVPTSSLSQGSHITLMSKTGPDDPIHYASISRMDRFRYDRAMVLNEDDLNEHWPQLLETTMFTEAYEKLSELSKGTIILVQYLHRNCYDAQNDAQLSTIKDATVERLRAYLGLVFEHYINGIRLIDHQGTVHPKNINIKVLGIDVDPIDPLMKNMIDVSRNGVRGTHHNVGASLSPVMGIMREFTVEVAVVPGAEGRGGIRPDAHDRLMKKALQMKLEGSGVGSAPITNCQGLYLYRNMRLIEFGTWKGIYQGGANYTCARAAVYGPVGFNISDQSMLYLGDGVNEGFSCDPSKITVNLSPQVLDRVENILEDDHQWHRLDDASKAGYTRASRRITYDARMDGAANPPVPAPRLPVLEIEMSTNRGPPPLEVQFTASNTNAVLATDFVWVIDNQTANGEQVDFTFEEVGIYNVTLQGSRRELQSRPTTAHVYVEIVEEEPSEEPRNATISEINDPDEDLLYLEANGDTDNLVVNRGSQYFSNFVRLITSRFGGD